jgi:hypothetical protein
MQWPWADTFGRRFPPPSAPTHTFRAPQEFINEDPNSGSNSPSPDENLATHPSFKSEFNPSAHDESFESYFALRRLRPASATPTPPSSPGPAPAGTGSAPNSSVRERESEVGKKQRHKEKLKLAGLDDSDSSALTQSGDEMGESSPPPQDPSRPGTEGGTEAGDEDAEMAERSSPGPFFTILLGSVHSVTLCATEPPPVPKPTKVQKGPKKGAFTRTRSGAAAASSRAIKKRKR